MNLRKTLLSRHGQISGRAYWIGCAVLLLLGVVLHLLAFGFIYAVSPDMIRVVGEASVRIGLGPFGIIIPSLFLISLLLYPYLCLYTKRLRDIGVSTWWFLAILLVYCTAYIAAPNIIFMLASATPAEIFTLQTNIAPDATPDEQVVNILDGVRKSLIVAAIFVASIHAVIALAIDVVLGKLKPRKHNDALDGNLVVAP